MAQESNRKPPAGRTQFTFTCESDSAKSMTWPSYGYTAPYGVYPGALPHGPDDSFDRGDIKQAMDQMTNANSQAQHLGLPPPGASPNGSQPKKSRRPLVKQYAMAARARRLRQNYNNFHHPPREEDVWICEYCEYEAIFGRPPSALIRQYEMKDRRERRRLAEKRRLLEKAKMKGKKGKKGGKNSKTGNHPSQTQSQQQQHPSKQQQYASNGIEIDATDQADVSREDLLSGELEDATTPTQAVGPAPSGSGPEPVHSGQSATGFSHSIVSPNLQ